MSGRHVYRVSPAANGGWSVHKEGESAARTNRRSLEEATRIAADLAAADEPSKVVIEEPGGTIGAEVLFGADMATPLEREAEGQDPRPRSQP